MNVPIPIKNMLMDLPSSVPVTVYGRKAKALLYITKVKDKWVGMYTAHNSQHGDVHFYRVEGDFDYVVENLYMTVVDSFSSPEAKVKYLLRIMNRVRDLNNDYQIEDLLLETINRFQEAKK